jgi:ABC-type branched-subunit amino acid transport system permease subunit
MTKILLKAFPSVCYETTGPLIGATTVALASIALFGNEQVLVLGVQTLIFVLFAMSLNLMVGNGGMVSMGHAAMLAVGGYVAGYLTKAGFGMASAAIVGIAATALLALVVALLCVGREPTAFIMLTLALAQLVYIVIWKWHEVTGGDEGLIGFAPPEFLRNTRSYFILTTIVVWVSLFLLYRVGRSSFGVALNAVRNNAQRASFAGLNVKALQIVAMVLSGTLAGVAGVLLAFFQRGMFVESAGFATSTNALLVCVLGGSGSFAGPILGALVFRAVTTFAPSLTEYWQSILGVVIVTVGLYYPAGLSGLIDQLRRITETGRPAFVRQISQNGLSRSHSISTDTPGKPLPRP